MYLYIGLAAALKQLQCGVKDVTVFESREQFLQPNLGGGLQLSGGAAVLEKLGCLSALEQTAHPFKGVLSRNSYGTELLNLDVADSVKTKASLELVSNNGNGNPLTYSIMRDALQEILYNATLSQTSGDVLSPLESRVIAESVDTTGSIASDTKKISSDTKKIDSQTVVTIKAGKKVSGVIENDLTGTVTLKFEDGTEESDFDAVFGADGAGSILRQVQESPNAPHIKFVISYRHRYIYTEYVLICCIYCDAVFGADGDKYKNLTLHLYISYL